MFYGYIYLTTNLINDKKYIGKRTIKEGLDPNNDLYLGSGTLIKKAIEKYGEKNFKKEILKFVISEEELNSSEIEFISEYNAVNSDDFYNILPGGMGENVFKHLSDEEKEEFRNKCKHVGEDNGFFGKHHSDETKSTINKKNSKPNEELRKFPLDIRNEMVDKCLIDGFTAKEVCEEYNIEIYLLRRYVQEELESQGVSLQDSTWDSGYRIYKPLEEENAALEWLKGTNRNAIAEKYNITIADVHRFVDHYKEKYPIEYEKLMTKRKPAKQKEWQINSYETKLEAIADYQITQNIRETSEKFNTTTDNLRNWIKLESTGKLKKENSIKFKLQAINDFLQTNNTKETCQKFNVKDFNLRGWIRQFKKGNLK